jgi:hypothetical protein
LLFARLIIYGWSFEIFYQLIFLQATIANKKIATEDITSTTIKYRYRLVKQIAKPADLTFQLIIR